MDTKICKKFMYNNRDKIINMEDKLIELDTYEMDIINKIEHNIKTTNNIKQMYGNIIQSYEEILKKIDI
jgi:hypothetical protein